MDLIDDPAPGRNAPEFSVSELSGAVKRVIEGEFAFVRVRGEVGRVSRPRSGHVYLDLKDDRAVLAGVIWKGAAARLATQPEEGLEVVATGRLTTFPGQSRYQIVIDDIRPAGVGALMAMLEKRRRALEAEGLFAPDRKKPLPYLPEVIGVVTSPSGAVIRDILHRLRDRFPRKVLVWPVAVQGEGSAAAVAHAIRGFNALAPGGVVPRPDVLIVARGGGSIEDLWGFNDEDVVRAAADSAIPLISAVGHETDTTLIDFAADRRAPTPTAAAEMAVPVRTDLLAALEGQGARLAARLAEILGRRRDRLRDLSRALPRPQALLEAPAQRADRAADALTRALRALVQGRRAAFSAASARLAPGLLSARIGAARDGLGQRSGRLAPALSRAVAEARRRLGDAGGAFSRRAATGTRARDEARAALARLWSRAGVAEARVRNRATERLGAAERMRRSLGYEATLGRGYALAWDGDALVTTAAEAQAAAALELQFRDGRMRPGGGRAQTARRGPAEKSGGGTPPGRQGTLF